jgi:DNA helicase HerA-like ATPase
MGDQQPFIDQINAGYTFKGDAILLGGAMLNGQALPGVQVKVPLSTMTRHGLIAGATGTGKTKSLQVLAEQLSAQGVPCLLMDVKGDLSGIAAEGTHNERIQERAQSIGITWRAQAAPVEFMSLSNDKGIRLRATVGEFGPVLFSRLLNLNDTQAGIVAVVFKYCDDHSLPLVDLEDIKKVMQYLGNEGKEAIEAEYGTFSAVSSATILRKIVELEQQGAALFFGELSFDVDDLVRFDQNGRGMLSIVRLTDIQDRPKLFSTFMLQLLAEIYEAFPEEGDVDRPKLCIFIDEAHLVFDSASNTLLQQIETIIKLIRSKGVGIFFITQNPTDVPSAVLAQLGFKLQHALRAFTAKDRKAIKLAAENYPLSDFYATEDLLTQLGTGEALVSALNEKGIPTPLVHTMVRPPESRMDILSAQELDAIQSQSALSNKYSQVIDRESARDILTEKMNEKRGGWFGGQNDSPATKNRKTEKSVVQEVMDNPLVRDVSRTLARELSRGILDVLGLGGRKRRR